MKVMQAAQRFDDDVERNMHTIADPDLRPRIVGMTEMCIGPNDDVRLSAARRILGPAGYNVLTGEDGGDHAHEIPIGVREDPRHHVQSIEVVQLSPNLPGDGLGNDRHLATAAMIDPKTKALSAHAQTHWNAGLQGPHGNMLRDPRVTAAEAGSKKMESILRGLLAEGRALTVGGDFNWRLHDNDPAFHVWAHSPKAMFERLGMECVTSGLDWLAWSDAYRQIGETVVVEPHTGGNVSDHPRIMVRLERKATR